MAASEQDIVGAPFAVTITGTGRRRAPTRPGGLEESARDLLSAAAVGAPAASAEPVAGGGEWADLHGIGLWFDIDFGPETFDPLRCRELAVRAAALKAAPPSAATGDADDDDAPPLEPTPVPSSAVSAPGVSAQLEDHYRVRFSTSPAHEPTHWVQTMLPFPAPLRVRIGDSVAGRITMRRDGANPREYHFDLELGGAHAGRRYAYHMS